MFLSCKKLVSIYVTNEWDVKKVTSSTNMFSNCTKIVGGNGTVYNSSKKDKTYARIDKAGTPGYLTQGTDPKPYDVAYFGYKKSGSTYNSILSNLTSLNYIDYFAPYRGQESEVQDLIENEIAIKIDDGSTNASIYAWYIEDNNALDYGTVYWWSDADTVYLTNKSSYLWSQLRRMRFMIVRTFQALPFPKVLQDLVLMLLPVVQTLKASPSQRVLYS